MLYLHTVFMAVVHGFLDDNAARFATMGAALVPAPLRAIVGPVMGLAEAKANAKKGISNVFSESEDYAWVCPCEGFAGYVATVKEKGKCPYDKEMGCTDIAKMIR